MGELIHLRALGDMDTQETVDYLRLAEQNVEQGIVYMRMTQLALEESLGGKAPDDDAA